METFLGMAFMLPMFGGLIMTVMPREWQSLSGWLMVSYLGIPGFLVVAAVLVSVPAIMFGALFFLGVAVVKK
jgi:hypothetical protein